MHLGDHCIYHHEGDPGESVGTVVRVRDNNRFDLAVDGFRDRVQMVKLGDGPGQCHPPGWEPTLVYGAAEVPMLGPPVPPPKRRRVIPRWSYPGIFAAAAWIGAAVAYALEVLGR